MRIVPVFFVIVAVMITNLAVAETLQRTAPMQMAPIKPRIVQLASMVHTVETDTSGAGVYILSYILTPSGVSGVDHMELRLFNKTNKHYNDVKFNAHYYSQIEQRWVQAGSGRPLGDLTPQGKKTVKNLSIISSSTQFTKLKLEIEVKKEGEIEPDYSGGPIYKSIEILKSIEIQL